jgi:hypothetical protein
MRKIPSAPALLVVFVLGACASFRPQPAPPEPVAVPPAERPAVLPLGPADYVGILPPESSVFASVKVDAFRTLLVPLFPSERSRKLLARTERVFAGFALPAREVFARGVPAPEVPAPELPAFSLIGTGDFSAARLSIPLCLSREWNRVGKRTWVQKEGSLEVAVPRKNLVLAANGALAGMLERYDRPSPYPLPAEVADRMKAAELLLYLPDLPDAAGGLAALPLEAVWLEAAPAGEDVRISAVFMLAEGSDPRRTEALFRLALAVWLRRESRGGLTDKLQALEIRAADGRIRLEGLLLSRLEIEDILNRWLAAPEDGWL